MVKYILIHRITLIVHLCMIMGNNLRYKIAIATTVRQQIYIKSINVEIKFCEQ